MRFPTEGASANRRPRSGSLVTTLMAALCVASPAFAQAPECSWGNGVALPGGDTRDVLVTSDGAAGLLAITWQVNTGAVYTSTIRLHHVLEQGQLDPALPADGVVIMSPAMLPEHPEYVGVRVVPDGAGGAYLLFRACISTLAHLRCWEASEMRLKHVTGDGTTVPGWPEAGRALSALGNPDPLQRVDIVPDGVGGVIAAWVDTANYASGTPPVRVQRFAADGTALWPGGFDGMDVLAPPDRGTLRLAGDGAGGCVVVTSQLASGSPTRFELKAGHVENDGSLPWSSAGRSVMAQPTASSNVHAVVMDSQGRAFVTALNTPTGPGTPHFWSQLLDPSGAPLWSPSAVLLPRHS